MKDGIYDITTWRYLRKTGEKIYVSLDYSTWVELGADDLELLS